MSYHPTGDLAHPPFTIESGTPDRFAGVERLADVPATMRDGVRLVADVYLPRAGTPAPTILVRLPYGKQTPEMGMDEVGRWLARKGYACVVQDVRGKFGSEGDFDPGASEVEDGYDTVDWAISQGWCNGVVGCWGESYYGMTSYAAAVSGHPAVRAIAPGDIGSDRRASWFRQGALQLNTTGYWAMAMDDREYADLSRIDPWHLPLFDMARAAGLGGRFFEALLDAAQDAGWWHRRGVAGRLGAIRCPVLLWSGWYDNYLGPLLADLVELQRVHPEPETVHLMVGPWDHEGSAGGTDRAACLHVLPTAGHRWDAYQGFFDRYLRGDDNRFGAGGRVDVYTLGRDRWQRSASWPPPESVPTSLWLRAGGALTWGAPAGDEPSHTFTYDPADPVDETIGGNCWALCTALVDRRRHDDRADILRYTSEPLDAELELTGPIRAVLHASSSAVDTDFTVTLCHVLADGVVNTIQDGIVRARYRDGMDAPRLLVLGEVVAYELDLFATSYVLPAGTRLRVDVSSSCFDRYDRNPNDGGPYGHAAEAVVARQAIHHGASTPSRVVLPVVRHR